MAWKLVSLRAGVMFSHCGQLQTCKISSCLAAPTVASNGHQDRPLCPLGTSCGMSAVQHWQPAGIQSLLKTVAASHNSVCHVNMLHEHAVRCSMEGHASVASDMLHEESRATAKAWTANGFLPHEEALPLCCHKWSRSSRAHHMWPPHRTRPRRPAGWLVLGRKCM